MAEKYLTLKIRLKKDEIEELYQLFNEKRLNDRIVKKKIGFEKAFSEISDEMVLELEKRDLIKSCIWALLFDRYAYEKKHICLDFVENQNNGYTFMFNKEFDKDITHLNVKIYKKTEDLVTYK